MPPVSLMLSPGPNRLKKLLKKKILESKKAFSVFHFITIRYHILGVAYSAVIVVCLNEAI